jgi:hypothetical protein
MQFSHYKFRKKLFTKQNNITKKINNKFKKSKNVINRYV